MTSKQRQSSSTTTDGEGAGRPLREKEIVSIFMGVGIYQHIAEDIVKTCSELKGITDKQVEDYKVVLREVRREQLKTF
jgi:hypothetical protein